MKSLTNYGPCISLQREQMLEAQEMFKNSNKVTRPEKALILGFMAGSRGKFGCRFYSSTGQRPVSLCPSLVFIMHPCVHLWVC